MSNGKSRGRKTWSQPLADLVAPSLTPALSQYGFGEADLVLYWPEIVGERLAARCRPLRLRWPVRAPERREAPEPATLMILVEGAFAIELQHQADLVIERVNGHVGWRCVGRLALRQGPVVPRTPSRRGTPAPEPAAVRRAQDAARDIGDDGLRDALVRLGARALSRPRAG